MRQDGGSPARLLRTASRACCAQDVVLFVSRTLCLAGGLAGGSGQAEATRARGSNTTRRDLRAGGRARWCRPLPTEGRGEPARAEGERDSKSTAAVAAHSPVAGPGSAGTLGTIFVVPSRTHRSLSSFLLHNAPSSTTLHKALRWLARALLTTARPNGASTQLDGNACAAGVGGWWASRASKAGAQARRLPPVTARTDRETIVVVG